MRGGVKAEQFGDIYESYRTRVGELIATTSTDSESKSNLTPYEFGVAQIALSHGLALQRAANRTLKATLPPAPRAFVRRCPRRSALAIGSRSTIRVPDDHERYLRTPYPSVN